MVHGEVSFVVSCSATAAPLTITAARMHIDQKNVGPSWAKGFGDYSGGGAVWEFGLHWPKKKKGFEGRPLKIKNSSQSFEGRLPHKVRPFESIRIPFVFLVRKGCQAAVKEGLPGLWGKVRRAQAVPTALAAKSLACCALGGRGFGFALSAYSFSSGQFNSILYCFGFRRESHRGRCGQYMGCRPHKPGTWCLRVSAVFLWLIGFATVLLQTASGIKNGHGPEVRRKTQQPIHDGSFCRCRLLRCHWYSFRLQTAS